MLHGSAQLSFSQPSLSLMISCSAARMLSSPHLMRPCWLPCFHAHIISSSHALRFAFGRIHSAVLLLLRLLLLLLRVLVLVLVLILVLVPILVRGLVLLLVLLLLLLLLLQVRFIDANLLFLS